VAMPEATVHEDNLATRFENEIRPPRKLRCMKPIPEAKGMNEPTDAHLGLGVLVADTAHRLTALFPRECVHLSNPSMLSAESAPLPAFQ